MERAALVSLCTFVLAAVLPACAHDYHRRSHERHDVYRTAPPSPPAVQAYENRRANALRHYRKAERFALRGKYAAAEAQYRAALKIDPDYHAARARLGYARFKLGDVHGAIAIFHDVLDKAPGYGEVHVWLAEALYYADRHEEAWDHVHQARQYGQRVPRDLLNKLSRPGPAPAQRGKPAKKPYQDRGREPAHK